MIMYNYINTEASCCAFDTDPEAESYDELLSFGDQIDRMRLVVPEMSQEVDLLLLRLRQEAEDEREALQEAWLSAHETFDPLRDRAPGFIIRYDTRSPAELMMAESLTQEHDKWCDRAVPAEHKCERLWIACLRIFEAEGSAKEQGKRLGGDVA